jgi:hypothetical protein
MIFVALMNVSNHGEFDKITMILVKFQSVSFAKSREHTANPNVHWN